MGGCTRLGWVGRLTYSPARMPTHRATAPRTIRVRSRRAHSEKDAPPVAVKIRLKRMGKIRAPFYRVVVMDSRTKRDGRAIEEIGKYHPTEEPSVIDINGERAQYWLTQGAQPTEAVVALFKVTGDWQKFKGTDGAEGTLVVKAAKRSKRELYDEAVAAAGKSLELKGGATARPKKAAKVEDAAPQDKPADKPVDKPADAEVADAPAADEAGA